MQCVGKALAEHERPWPNVASVALRTRPGDRPAWLRLDAEDGELDQLRAAAAHARLPVDVAAALQAEWGLCQPAIGTPRIPAVLESARVALGQARLAPEDDLRAWDRLLAGRGPVAGDDELPELCLPQRLAFRLPRRLPSAALELAHVDVASLCDRAACRYGMTMETWVLRAALGAPDPGAAG